MVPVDDGLEKVDDKQTRDILISKCFGGGIAEAKAADEELRDQTCLHCGYVLGAAKVETACPCCGHHHKPQLPDEH